MAFTFSDPIAGYVKRYDRNADSFTHRDERRPRVHGRADRHDATPSSCATWASRTSTHRPDARHARARPLRVRLRDLLPGGRRRMSRGQAPRPSSARTPDEFVFEKPDWWVKQIAQLADFYLRAQFGDGDVDFRDYRVGIDMTGDKIGRPPGDRHDLAAHLRLRTAYLLTGEDRFLEAAEKGIEYLREHLRIVDTRRGRRLLVPRHRRQRAEREEDPRLRVRRRLRRHPGLRADLRAGRADPDLPHHRRPADPRRHRHDDHAVRAVLPRPRARRLLLAPRPDHVRPQERRRWATTGRARTGTRSATTPRPT